MSEATVTIRNGLLILLAVLLQTSWVNSFAIWDVRPDVVLLVVVFVGITRGQIAATVFGFASGFLLDVYDPESMGLNSLANSVVGFAVAHSRPGVVAEDFRVQAVILLLAGLLHDLVYFAIHSISDPMAVPGLLLRYGLGAAIYTSLVGLGISVLMSIRIDKGIHLDARRLHG